MPLVGQRKPHHEGTFRPFRSPSIAALGGLWVRLDRAAITRTCLVPIVQAAGHTRTLGAAMTV